MSYSRAARFETQRSLGFASIVAGYAAVGTEFYYTSRILIVYNGTDALLQFSQDGANDNFVIPANGQMVVDLSANALDEVPYFIPAKTLFRVKRIGTPTSGSVYVMAVYGKDD